MPRIALAWFASPLHEGDCLEASHRAFLDGLRRDSELVIVNPGDETDADLQVAFIASGGTEAVFRDACARLPRPLLLMADGKHNSLPAALEIMSWLRRRSEAVELLHGDPEEVRARLHRLLRCEGARRALAGRIGVVGPPSDWLIGSDVDRQAARRRWGTGFVDIPLAELEELADGVEPDQADAAARRFRDAASAAGDGVDDIRLRAAARLYPALKTLFGRHHLAAITLRCFALLGSRQTTGCLALSLLNDEGRIAGCEGDVAAVFSMLLLQALSGEVPFMANPSRIDARANQVTLAHCTVAGRACRGYRVRSHFESGIGVGVQGDLAPGPVTLFKAGGADLGEYFVSAGTLIEAPVDEGMCRTQARVCLQEPVDYFFRAPLANHHVLVRGDHAGLVREFMAYAGQAFLAGPVPPAGR